MKISFENLELFKKILFINYPKKPKIYSIFYDGKEATMEFEVIKNYSKEDKKKILAGYSKFGLFFSREDLIFPDLLLEPKEIKISKRDSFSTFFWEEKFPKDWENFFKNPLYLFVPSKNLKGYSTISKYFFVEGVLRGKSVLYFDLKNYPKDPYENFYNFIQKRKYDFIIFDHIECTSQASFEKFLIFILKSLWENYEILATQWPGKVLPQGNTLEIPNFNFSELIKLFYFPEISYENFINLLEEKIKVVGWYPANLVYEFLKDLKILKEKKDENKPKVFFEKEKVEKSLKEGKLFEVYPFFEDIKKSEKLYLFILAWQGDGETLSNVLKEPFPEILNLIFSLGWDGFIDLEFLKKYLNRDLYLLVKNKKKISSKEIENLIEKEFSLKNFLKLLYADKILTIDKEKAEKIFKELFKEKEGLNLFEESQLYRYFSYLNYYKGDFEEAINFAKKWLKISEENGWLWQCALAYNDLGVYFTEIKEFERAISAYKTSLNFSLFLCEEKKESTILFNLGVLHLEREELEKSKEIFKKLKEIHKKNQENYSLIFDLYELAKIYYFEGDINYSYNLIKEGIKYLKEYANHPWLYKFYILKTYISSWISKEEYMNSLRELKELKNIPHPFDLERDYLLKQGILRGVLVGERDLDFKERVEEENFNIDTIKSSLEILEYKNFYKDKGDEEKIKNALHYLEKRGILKWKTKFFEKDLSSFISFFKIFLKEKIDLEEIPFSFKLILKDGREIKKGDDENLNKLELPEGFFLYIPKNIKEIMPEEILYGWAFALIERLSNESRDFEMIIEEMENFQDFYYSSYKVKKIVEKAKRFAKNDIPIHIFGETGTGKEVLARAIHETSKRFMYPFVPVNCSAIPENLFESEFFGWKKGAFTGALMDRAGYFEQADRGTLFLDEVGELTLNHQAKLLRVLQEKEIQRLGDEKRKKIDFRLISATNKDLKKLVEGGKFREDLYYRIVVGVLNLPPLRERKEEIIPLAKNIIYKNLKTFGIKALKIDPFFLSSLEKREWKGNVRELENFILSLLANLEEGETLKIEEFVFYEKGEKEKLKGNYHQLVNDFKRQLIEEALKKAKGSRKGAAKILGITPQALSYIKKELKMVK